MARSENLPVTIYTKESQIRTPRQLARSMIKDLKASTELSWTLFIRDITAQYRQSLLGVLWTFLPPIVTSFVFIVLQNSGVMELGNTAVPYPVYVLVGTILWQIFTDSLNSPLKAVKSSQAMIVKINFPREALIVSGFLLVLFNSLIKIVVLIGVLLVFEVKFTPGILLASIPTFMLILLGIGSGLLLVPIGLLYSDVSAALPTVTQILFFLTPVVYVAPQTFPYSLLTANPITPLLVAARDLITTGQMSNFGPCLAASALALALAFFSWILYRIGLPIVIERISA